MSLEDIYLWAHRYHYPSLRLSATERLYAGRAEWDLYLSDFTYESLARLVQAIERWNTYMAQAKEQGGVA